MTTSPESPFTQKETEGVKLYKSGRASSKPEKPPLWAIVLHNDATTQFMFVMKVLNTAFSLPDGVAQSVMMAAHNDGVAIVKVCTAELAETQMEIARHMIAAAQRIEDYVGARCDLTFSTKKVEP